MAGSCGGTKCQVTLPFPFGLPSALSSTVTSLQAFLVLPGWAKSLNVRSNGPKYFLFRALQ